MSSEQDASPAPAVAVPGVVRRIAYWLPVLAALALFAQVALLGLRPAIAEARRLAQADEELSARFERDRALGAAYDLELRVRRDPVFLERQRRLRRTVPSGA